jgi:hypothetical protein
MKLLQLANFKYFLDFILSGAIEIFYTFEILYED